VREGCFLYLVMEYCSGGTLEDYLNRNKRISEEQTKHLMSEIAAGLKYLRDQKVVHRDLKPANILLHYGAEGQYNDGTLHLKITDFTFARSIEPGDLAYTLCGSPLYMAPEIFQDHQYTDKGDLWSLGVVMFQMLYGQVPFPEARTLYDLATAQQRPIVIPQGISISREAENLVLGFLQKDPNLRIEWEDFFSHPLINLVPEVSQKSSPNNSKSSNSSVVNSQTQDQNEEESHIEELTRLLNESQNQLNQARHENEVLRQRLQAATQQTEQLIAKYEEERHGLLVLLETKGSILLPNRK